MNTKAIVSSVLGMALATCLTTAHAGNGKRHGPWADNVKAETTAVVPEQTREQQKIRQRHGPWDRNAGTNQGEQPVHATPPDSDSKKARPHGYWSR